MRSQNIEGKYEKEFLGSILSARHEGVKIRGRRRPSTAAEAELQAEQPKANSSVASKLQPHWDISQIWRAY
jgi:hypothetical protein